MQDIQPTSTQLLDNEKSDLEQAAEQVCEAKQSLDSEWAKESFDFVAMKLKEMEAMN